MRVARLLAHASLVDRIFLRTNSQRGFQDLQAVTRSFESLTRDEQDVVFAAYGKTRFVVRNG
jgi:hypothetical protein